MKLRNIVTILILIPNVSIAQSMFTGDSTEDALLEYYGKEQRRSNFGYMPNETYEAREQNNDWNEFQRGRDLLKLNEQIQRARDRREFNESLDRSEE